MIHLSFTQPGEPYGWSVCCDQIERALSSFTETHRITGEDSTHPFHTLDPVVHVVQGHTFKPLRDWCWSWTRNIGLCFLEDLAAAQEWAPYARKHFQCILAGSTWLADALYGILGIPVYPFIQGVDTNLFFPTHSTTPSHSFLVYSGGKFEYRKGQDLVIAAFKSLMDQYPDMHLVCSWRNLWESSLHTMGQSTHILFPVMNSMEWKSYLSLVMQLNGIPSHRYTLLDLVPHQHLPDLYRQCHVGIYLSRCEGGTNLPLMETMACGVPVIATQATGHLDVVDPDHCICVSGTHTRNDWFDPDLNSVVVALERSYHGRDALNQYGTKASRFIRNFTWHKTAQQVFQACYPKGPAIKTSLPSYPDSSIVPEPQRITRKPPGAISTSQ